jgi:hypothetical protein
MEPFIDHSLDDFYGDLTNNSNCFIFQWHVISELTKRNREFKGQNVLLESSKYRMFYICIFTPVLHDHEQGYITDRQKMF